MSGNTKQRDLRLLLYETRVFSQQNEESSYKTIFFLLLSSITFEAAPELCDIRRSAYKNLNVSVSGAQFRSFYTATAQIPDRGMNSINAFLVFVRYRLEQQRRASLIL